MQGKFLYFVLFGCQIPLDGCLELNFLVENFFMDTPLFLGELFISLLYRRFVRDDFFIALALELYKLFGDYP